MRTRWIIAAVLVIVGAVWVGQALGFVRGSSFMDGDPRWALFGAIVAAVGIFIGWGALRMRRRV